ncbi:MAG: S8 family serine peptidase [Verrucomicrobiota bacterium]
MRPSCFPAVLAAFLLCGGVALASQKVRVADPQAARDLVKQGARPVADYGAFQVLEVDTLPAGADRSRVQLENSWNFIRLNGGILDTRRPELRAARKAAASFSGARLHLLQFAGPVKPEWLEALKATGVRVTGYIPENAYLVYGDSAALQRLQSWADGNPVVQWNGSYASADKIHPFARPGKLSKNTAESSSFAIQLLDDPDANPATLRLLERLRTGPVRQQFRSMNYLNIVVPLPAGAVDAVAAQPDVVSIHAAPERGKFDERQAQIVAGAVSGGAPTGPGYLAWLATKGFSQAQFDASGFVVDMTDSGIDNGTAAPGHFGLYRQGDPGQSSRVIYNRLEGTPNSGSTLQGCDGHGTVNAHILAGYSARTGFPFADSSGYSYGLGICPFVRIGSSVIFDPNYYTSPNFPALQSDAYQDGARISANSWGTTYGDGTYDIAAQTYDALVRDAQPPGSPYPTPGNQPMVIVFAAGNSGPGAQTISSPGTAKNVITVGASESVRSLALSVGGVNAVGDSGCLSDDDTDADNANDIAAFSGRGPCADGRMKPDLVAPGTHVTGGAPQSGTAVTNGTGSGLACFDASGICALPGHGITGSQYNFFPLSQQFYTVSSGTSQSTPAVAGACALLRQWFLNASLPPPSPALTKAALVNSAAYLTGTDANDNLWSPAQGMGGLSLDGLFDGVPRVFRDQVPADKFTATGQARTFSGVITDPSKPFRVTLAWTDAPGTTAAVASYNNDLDLVVSVGGHTYLGNVFSGGYSTTGGSADYANNVESVFLPAGLSGTFVVTVTAANINSDGVPDEAPAQDQDFALVIYNAATSSVPVLSLEGVQLTAENCLPTNNAVDPGETVTLAYSLRNLGPAATTNLVLSLLATNGAAMPSAPQWLGIIPPGTAFTQSVSFTAYGTCGGNIAPTLQAQDGSLNLGLFAAGFPLGALTETPLAASNPVVIVFTNGSIGPAGPYPSLITLSGVTGIVAAATVELSDFEHGFPFDVDFLLAGPSGTNVMLMSQCGGSYEVEDLDLVFDDTATQSLPYWAPMSSGTYLPTSHSYDSFDPPAPAYPYGTALSAFAGSDPNGTWSLWGQQTGPDSGGVLGGGWRLNLTLTNLTCCSGAPPPAPRILSITVTNNTANVTWSTVPGNSYQLQSIPSLGTPGWSTVGSPLVATNLTSSQSGPATNSARTFYRIQAN